MKNIKTLKDERNCGFIELQLRRFFSGMFYWRIYRKLHKNYPYYTPGATKFLLRIINNSMEVFEWGSGLSSVWFAKRVKQVYITEHDKLWYDKVKEWLRVNGLTNAKLNLIEPVSGSFQNYCSSIEKYENESLDIIAVDGRDRINCIRHSLDKLKRGGYILLDDSHRPKYSEAFKILKDFEIKRFDFGLLQTAIFRKPKKFDKNII